MGKNGQPGTHFIGKLQVYKCQIGGRSFLLYGHHHFKYLLCKTFVSQWERRVNQGLISIGNYKFGSVKLELGVSGFMDILILNTYPARSLSFCDNGKCNALI